MSAMGMTVLRRRLPAARRGPVDAGPGAGGSGRTQPRSPAVVAVRSQKRWRMFPVRARRPWPCRARCSESTDDVLPRNVVQQQRSRRRFDMTAPA